ncbi:HAD family hydrolase [Lentzea kentuckyensis]|uniref:HAD family hydrolase n=1 Tax=Lentzea kentuckyensis TaxID=360086 RepID=UPI000A374767|nr:HAD family hydrolase [Lentzea kentuckyensis]
MSERVLWTAEERTSGRAAFFDVDGTVTTRTTMFRFLEFLCARRGRPEVYREARQRLRDMTAAGLPRERTNRAYFTNLQDLVAGHVDQVAAEWFAAELAEDGLFRPPVLDVIAEHRRAGDLVVLVSGSFPACLLPVARHVGADVVLCSMPEISAGRYTGRVGQPMIGAEKALAVQEFAALYGVSLAASAAYGDHLSDSDLLAAVGRPVVVGDDQALVSHAREHGWELFEEKERVR